MAFDNEITIEKYMSQRQFTEDCIQLIDHFQQINNLSQKNLKTTRKAMKSVDWGTLYSKYWNYKDYGNIDALNEKVDKLMADEEVKNKKGIYYYVFDNNEKHLNLRAFDESTKTTIYEKQGSKCAKCNVLDDISEMEADHIKPWSQGGKTNKDNCQVLCKKCNREKGAK